jgi:hypothetical protein
MNRVLQIKEEMERLENHLEQLKEELHLLQMNCNHEFKRNDYTQECIKCYVNESLNW